MSSEQPHPAAVGGEDSNAAAGGQPGEQSVEDIRKQVETEQALSDAQRKVKDLEAEVERIKNEVKRLEEERSGSDSTANQLRAQLSTLQSQYHKATSELSVSQTREASTEREKRELVEEVERLQQRSSRNTQELQSLRAQRTDASQKIAQLNVEVSELKMAAESAKFNEQRAVQALSNTRNEILTLSKASADVEERFGKYRADMQTQLSVVQQEKDKYLTDLTASQDSYQALQRTYNDQSRRLADAHANIATLTSAAAHKKATSTSELSRLLDENRILEKRAEEARITIANRESELEKLFLEQEKKEQMWEEKQRKEERLRKEAEKRSNDMKLVVDRLTMVHGDGQDLSPAAALAMGQKKDGKSYTQFYLDYAIQENKLRQAEEEVIRLTALLDEISADISEKKPLLDEQAAEHAAAIDRANALAAELAAALTARDRYENEAKSKKAEVELRTNELASVQSTADDLSRQVQGLVRQIEIQNDPALANIPLDGDAEASTGDIITDHLVEFRSIRSLQEQNVKLLKLTRGLMAKLDSQEINRATTDDSDIQVGLTLDQATETIEKLHSQLLDAQRKINEVIRERDTLSKLLVRGDGLRKPAQISGPGDNGSDAQEALVQRLQEEMSEERRKADEEVEKVRKELGVKKEEVGTAEVGRAQAEAKATLLKEQLTMANEAQAIQKTQYASLESRYRQVEASINQANNDRRQALEQAASKQAEADKLRNEAANLRAEKEQWKSTEDRLQSDFRTVQSERARLQQLIDGLNNVNAENEKTRTEERIRLEKRADELEKDKTKLQAQIDQAKEATRAAEKRVEDFDARIATATAAVTAEKDAAESLAKSRQDELTTLRAELEKITTQSKQRLDIGLKHQNRVKEANIQIAEKDKQIMELKEKVESTTKEIETATAKISELQKKLEEVEKGSAHKDSTVQRLSSELAAKGNAPSTPSPTDNAALAALRKEKEDLQQKLTQAEKDLAEANSASAAPATGSAGGSSSDAKLAELQAKCDQLQKDKDAYDAKYEENVAKVNRSNVGLNKKANALQQEKLASDQRIATLEKEIAELKAKPTASAGEGSSSTTDQSAIDAAVKAAVEAKEAELKAEHAKALESAKQAPPASGGAADGDASLDTRKAELESTFETRVNESVSAKSAEFEAEKAKLVADIEELKAKVKNLERQNKTAEITRKTLERQKQDAESKLKKLEDKHGAATPGAAEASGSKATTAITTPSTTAGSAGGEAKAAPTGPTGQAGQAGQVAVHVPSGPSKTGQAVRGTAARGTAVRGRGARGGAARGRGGGVLASVNATLQASDGTTPAAAPAAAGAAGQKRPLAEEGEISETPATGTTTPAAAGAGPARVLKRPRGPGPGPAGAGAEAKTAGGDDTKPAEASGGDTNGGAGVA